MDSKSRSTIGEGGDTTIPSPGRSPKQPLPGIGLNDPLQGRQACPECNSFYQRVGKICRWQGLFSCPPFLKRGQFCYIPAPPQIVEQVQTTLTRAAMMATEGRTYVCADPSIMAPLLHVVNLQNLSPIPMRSTSSIEALGATTIHHHHSDVVADESRHTHPLYGLHACSVAGARPR